MNEHALLHIPDSNFCFSTGENKIVLRLRTQKNEALEKVLVIHACKYDFQVKTQASQLEKKYTDKLFDYYEIEMIVEDVRFAYIFQIQEQGKTYYYSEDGLTTTYQFELGYYNFFQLPYMNKDDTIETIDWMRSAVFYQIFVERFFRADYKKDDSYITMKWGEKPNSKSFAGGDIKGIMSKLDYIKSLGVNTIYLTPVFTSISNHKYDIIDYKKIDPQFGSNDDFKILVKTAHEKGIRIVLDAVFNHCSSLMMQFQDVIKNGLQSEYYHWFIIDGKNADIQKGNYDHFGICPDMPKLNTSNEQVRQFLLDIASYWISEYDIDGWRLDVSDEIPHDFWRLFRKTVKSIKKDCVIIGENWHNAYPFLMGDQYDSIMNYAFTKASLDYFAFNEFTPQDMADKLNHILMRNKKPINEMMMNLLDSHDTHRFFTQIGKDKNKLLAALAIETCFTGVPCLYYGTELCMEGGYDPDCRRTFDWDEANWDTDFIQQLKLILALKKTEPLQKGEIHITADSDVLIMKREYDGNQIVLYHNRSKFPISLESLKEDHYQILIANLLDNALLQQEGFLVIKAERRKA